MTSPAAIELENVVKDFRFDWRSPPVRALDGLTLRVPSGQVVGLLGPNGCGKSTTIKVMLGLCAPTSGTCRVWGQPPGNRAARQSIGYLPEPLPLHRHLTGEEMVRYHARLAGVPRRNVAARVAQVLELVGLGAAATRRVQTYSTGMLRRVGLAQALVHDPQLLILDEPTAGVDPAGVETMLQLILAQRAAGKTVLVASHLLSQVDDICDRVALVNRGRSIAEGEVHALAAAEDRESLVVDRLDSSDRQALHEWLAARGRRLHTTERLTRRLDQVFLRRVRETSEVSDR